MCLVVFAPVAEARREANPTLYVNYFTNGTIAVTLADGTPIGSTSGTPTVIPAGYYSIVYSGPGGCSALPAFHLTGPGASIVTTMYEGAVQNADNAVYFQPGSTYIWVNDMTPSVLHAFTTSGEIVGTPPAQTTTTSTTPRGKGVTSTSVIGSQVKPLLGTLAGSVSEAGRLALTLKGKPVTALKAGRYTFVVDDKSSTAGFSLRHSTHVVGLTGSAFRGKRSATVTLGRGIWQLAPSSGKATSSVVVS